jgi:hypothetical protein
VPSSRAAATPDVAARRGQGGADAQVRPQLKLYRGDPIHYEFTLVNTATDRAKLLSGRL